MKTENRKQGTRMDISIAGFVIENRYRDTSDLVNICQRYAGVVRQEALIKK